MRLHKLLCSIFVFTIATSVLSQSEYINLKQQIKANTSFLKDLIIREHLERDSTFDETIYCDKTARKIVKLLTYDESRTLDIKEFRNLELAVETNDERNIRIYNFGYDCGGSRGWITHPIIQWINKEGKLSAFNFSSRINVQFNEIYTLSDDLYLLLGDEKAYSNCMQNIAYVIQFKGDYLILDYPAFVDRPYLNFLNVNFTFDDKTKVLTGNGIFNPQFTFTTQPEFLNNKETINKLYSLLAIDADAKEFKIAFKNRRFHKTRKNNSNSFYGIYEEDED